VSIDGYLDKDFIIGSPENLFFINFPFYNGTFACIVGIVTLVLQSNENMISIPRRYKAID
jgi:hypothetical protein